MKINECDVCMTQGKVTPTRTRLTCKHGGLSVAVHACESHVRELKAQNVGIEALTKLLRDSQDNEVFVTGHTFIKQN